MIETNFDVSFVAQLAQREKQIQQSYRPIIGVHKWFARRPGALFRALLLSEFVEEEPLPTAFFQSHNLSSRIVGDPFMGGGTPLLEANRLGCHVVGADINPMAYWIVRQELGELDRNAFRQLADGIIASVEEVIGHLYQTTCVHCGQPAQVKYFLWVKRQSCARCRRPIDIFSNYLVAKNQRHPNYVLACPTCGSLNEVSKLDTAPGSMRCENCKAHLLHKGPAAGNRCLCSHCGHENRYPNGREGPPEHRLYALEYHCTACAPIHHGRFFKAPDANDLARLDEAEKYLHALSSDHTPTQRIPPGDETARLHRWGYQTYRQLFNSRQLFSLNTLISAIAAVSDETIRHALLTVFSDSLRYQNMLCRYDTYALKIIDIFSVHGFPVSLIQCENSVLGIPGIGSGGFQHFIEKYGKAKAYAEKPFEKLLTRPAKKIFLRGEEIRARVTTSFPDVLAPKSAYLEAVSADKMGLPPASLDAILTDPPYFANVQYAELMDFCYTWLRPHLAGSIAGFRSLTTRTDEELTVNRTEERDITHFTEGLSRVFMHFTHALKPGAPFAFTYHHNSIEAYLPITVALLDACLVCTTTLPCPAEMGASIHISGTKSSVVDTIFVSRTTGKISRKEFQATSDNLKWLLKKDMQDLQQAGIESTVGDARCLLYGHLTRLVIWGLRTEWSTNDSTQAKLACVKDRMQQIYPLDLVDKLAAQVLSELTEVDLLANFRTKEETAAYAFDDQISF